MEGNFYHALFNYKNEENTERYMLKSFNSKREFDNYKEKYKEKLNVVGNGRNLEQLVKLSGINFDLLAPVFAKAREIVINRNQIPKQIRKYVDLEKIKIESEMDMLSQ